jgi:purine nucleoside phosphorylase
VPVRLSIVGGSGQVDLDGVRLGQKGGMATVESPGFGRAKDRYEIEVVGGSKAVEIVARRAPRHSRPTSTTGEFPVSRA